LGDWIGSNSEKFYLSIRQYFPGDLSLNLWTQVIKLGKKETVDEEYYLPFPGFLYGDKSYYNSVGVDLQSEIIYNISGKVSYEYVYKSTNRFISEYFLTNKHNYNFSIFYGF
jgi:hypothetical protein